MDKSTGIMEIRGNLEERKNFIGNHVVAESNPHILSVSRKSYDYAFPLYLISERTSI